MFVFSLPFLPFALLILQCCLTAAHPIKAPARIDLQPLLTLMQMSAAQLIGVVLGAAGWSFAFRGNFKSRKNALTARLQVICPRVFGALLIKKPAKTAPGGGFQPPRLICVFFAPSFCCLFIAHLCVLFSSTVCVQNKYDPNTFLIL